MVQATQNNSVKHFEKFEMFLEKANQKYREIYITGDINCDMLSNRPEFHTVHLLDSTANYQLSQVIKEPTRISTSSKTLIDVFLTNDKENIINSGVYLLSIDKNLVIMYC